MLSNGFGNRPVAGGALSISSHLSKIPVTPGKEGLAVATPDDNGGPGAGAYDTRPVRSDEAGVKWSDLPEASNRRSTSRQSKTPAPHDYDVRRGESLLSTVRPKTTGGVIAGRSKSELDRQILAASKRPGPLDYAPRLPNSVHGVTRRSTSFGPSELERIAQRAAETPGPGLYFMSTGSRPPMYRQPARPDLKMEHTIHHSISLLRGQRKHQGQALV